MELRQLVYFLAIADAESLSRASAVLGIAQPALSRQMRRLEEELAVTLFYRHGRGVRVTDEGARFRMSIAPIVRDLLQAKADIASDGSEFAGSIMLALPPSIGAAIGSRLVQSFLNRHPNVKLHLVEGFSGHVNEWLVSNRVDMAVVNKARRTSSIRMDPLLTVDLFYLSRARSGARSAAPAQIGFGELASAPLLLPGRHHGLRRTLDTAAQRAGIELNILVEIDALAALKELVRSGVGATVLPQGALLAEMGDPDLIVQRVVDPPLSMPFMIAYSLERPVTFAMRELARTLGAETELGIREGRILGRLDQRHGGMIARATIPI